MIKIPKPMFADVIEGVLVEYMVCGDEVPEKAELITLNKYGQECARVALGAGYRRVQVGDTYAVYGERHVLPKGHVIALDGNHVARFLKKGAKYETTITVVHRERIDNVGVEYLLWGDETINHGDEILVQKDLMHMHALKCVPIAKENGFKRFQIGRAADFRYCKTNSGRMLDLGYPYVARFLIK